MYGKAVTLLKEIAQAILLALTILSPLALIFSEKTQALQEEHSPATNAAANKMAPNGRTKQAPTQQAITVGYVHFPPITYTVQGQPSGIGIDFFQESLQGTGQRFEFMEMPPARLYKNITSGQLQACICVRGDETMRKATLASQRPLRSISLVLYGQENNPVPALETLHNQKVIVVRGYHYNGKINILKDPSRQIKLLHANTHKDAVRMLIAGRAPLLLDYKTAVEKTISPSAEKKLASRIVEEINVHFILSRQTPNAETLLSLFDTAYEKYLADQARQPPATD